MSNLLETELKTILERCQDAKIPLFVIGAFSIRAYDCLLRISRDIDLAVSSEHWPNLKRVLTIVDGNLPYTAIGIHNTSAGYFAIMNDVLLDLPGWWVH